MNFSQNLNYLIQQSEITAYKLSQETGIPQAMIGRWKNGQQKPTTENLQKLADYFGVTVDYLLGKESFRYSPTKEILEFRKVLGNDYRLQVITTQTCVCKELENGYLLVVDGRSIDKSTGDCNADIEVWNYDQQPFIHESVEEIKSVDQLIQKLKEWEDKYRELPPLRPRKQKSFVSDKKAKIQSLNSTQKQKLITSKSDELDPMDKRIIELLHSLTPENRKIALAQLDAMLKIQGN